MEIVTVAAPDQLAEQLRRAERPWLRVLTWDGRPPPPADVAELDMWVPPYDGGLDRETVAASLGSLSRVGVVQLMSAGVEPWPEILAPEVTLCSGRGIHGGSTAELAVALVLALVRDLPLYTEQQRRREWRSHPSQSLAGCRALVLGAGDIGRRVATVLEALEAHVVVVGRRPRDGVLGMGDVPKRLPTTDLVVVAVPLTAQTARLVDADFLAALPDGAVLVNVGRGGIVDTDALTAEVAAGRLRAGLDVTDPEPLPADHRLWELPGALLTPHVGGGTAGWAERARRLVLDQLERLHQGTGLRNVVEEGY